MLLHKALSGSHQEAFSRDSKLVQKAREDYYWENCPCFISETSCIMADVFWSMIKSASLLGSEIYKLKEIWNGLSELQYANYTLRTLLIEVATLPPSVPLRVPKGHGPNWHPPSQCTPLFQWGNPLPMVWERRAE